MWNFDTIHSKKSLENLAKSRVCDTEKSSFGGGAKHIDAQVADCYTVIIISVASVLIGHIYHWQNLIPIKPSRIVM